MIDLHMHTIYSDGTDDIETLVDKWIDHNFKFVSITDHDNIGGVNYLINNKKLMDKLSANNIKFISGIEFSSVIDDFKLHLLGYNMDITNPDFIAVVDMGKKKRLHKFEERVIALKSKYNVEFSEDSLKELRDKDCFLGKPIMVKYMLRDGMCEDRKQGFSMLTNLTNPMETRCNAKDVIPGITKAQGICVWAHPLGGVDEPRNSYEKVEEILQKLIPLGLQGLECYYNLYTTDEINNLVAIAKKYNLKISAGSDYHGKNKTVALGQLSVDGLNFIEKDKVTLLD